MFLNARNNAGLSREKAAGMLNVGTRTLQNYEFSFSIVPPETALRMQEVYQDPTLTARYCSDYCPIGQVFAHRVPENQHLCSAVLGLLKEQADVEQLREKLIEITADGIIDHHEMPHLEHILEELMDLEKKIAEFKLHVANLISIPAMMQKRKQSLQTASR